MEGDRSSFAVCGHRNCGDLVIVYRPSDEEESNVDQGATFELRAKAERLSANGRKVAATADPPLAKNSIKSSWLGWPRARR